MKLYRIEVEDDRKIKDIKREDIVDKFVDEVYNAIKKACMSASSILTQNFDRAKKYARDKYQISDYDIDDAFFMIRDYTIVPYEFDGGSINTIKKAADCIKEPITDNNIKTIIRKAFYQVPDYETVDVNGFLENIAKEADYPILILDEFNVSVLLGVRDQDKYLRERFMLLGNEPIDYREFEGEDVEVYDDFPYETDGIERELLRNVQDAFDKYAKSLFFFSDSRRR